MIKKTSFILSLLVLSIFSPSGLFSSDSGKSIYSDYVAERNYWVDSVFTSLEPLERIGQFFMVAAYSGQDEAHKKSISNLIKKHKVGGIIFFKGHPVKQANWTNDFQRLSKVPLMISIDGEWGLSMRLDSTIQFPRQLTLGAVQNNDLIYEMGYEIGRQCKMLGIHVNLAPVIDVNNNANNPVINDRSFGENKFNVALKGLAYMNGMQNAGIMACAKHFPGHGDTDQDSHKTLPVINHSVGRMKAVELFPFNILFSNGLKSVMVAHINVPSLDDTPDLAASLSPRITTKLLKESMGFDGLVFSDALNMKGVTKFYDPGEVDAEAFLAGNDILLFSEDIPTGIAKINEAVANGKITQEEVDRRVKKVLRAKYELGLHKNLEIDTTDLHERLNSTKANLLNKKLYESAITIASAPNKMLPFTSIDTVRFASVGIGSEMQTIFQNYLGLYAKFSHFNVSGNASLSAFKKLETQLDSFDRVIVGIHEMSRYASKGYGLSDQTIRFLQRLNQKKEVIVVAFGSPYSIGNFNKMDGVVVAYEDNEITQKSAAQVLFGGIRALGKLPVTADDQFIYGSGIMTESVMRLKYTEPEELGIASADLAIIDTIALEAIAEMATPGCQVLVAKEGKVIYNRSFGHHTYEQKIKVDNNHLYDLASITKIGATTLSLMKLYDQDVIDINDRVKEYLPDTDSSNIRDLLLKNILIHQAGLTSWIPFYKMTIRDSVFEDYYCTLVDGFEVCVSKDLFIRNDYPDTIWHNIKNSFINPRPKYVYSDLGFYIFERMIHSLTGQRLDAYANHNFYQPLGLSYMTYNPTEKFSLDQIIPTEVDGEFRKTMVHGYVHDPGAAMLGGVGGHAGLFSNANDLAIMMQMLLNGGAYGGRQFINPNTVKLFTSKQNRKGRRGLGFDKPETDPDKNGPTCEEASPSTFGHSGFTGTGVWVDPEYDLIYVFLSNRVYPDATNWKLVELDIRTRIQSAIYQAMYNANKAKLTYSN